MGITTNDLALELCYKKNHVIRTREDLYNIKLNPSSYIVKLERDSENDNRMTKPSQYFLPENIDSKLANAFIQFQRIRAITNSKWCSPKLSTRLDKLRYKLHLKLIEWKVII